MKPSTRVNHQSGPKLDPDNTPLVPPLHQSVKYSFSSVAALEQVFAGKRQGYVYSRVHNPTCHALETLLAELQGTESGIVLSSGVAAITHFLLTSLKAGDHVTLFYESYKPTRTFVREFLGRFGVEHSVVSLTDKPAIAKDIQANRPKVVIFESPTNPVLKVADIEFICDLCQKVGATTVLDNTFAGFHNHAQYPIDVYIHSLTKFANGHGDTLGGAILASAETVDALRLPVAELGASLDASAANRILRGMKTYFLRTEKQAANAMRIAQWLEQQEGVEKVIYPGLASHPQHELAKRQMKDFGAVISCDVIGGRAELHRFVDSLKLFRVTGSLGDTESLIAPSMLFYGMDLSEQERTIADISEGTIRLAIGIEDVEDLLADLEQAMKVVRQWQDRSHY